MQRYSFTLGKEAKEIENVVAKVLDNGYRAADIYIGKERAVWTKEMGDLIAKQI